MLSCTESGSPPSPFPWSPGWGAWRVQPRPTGTTCSRASSRCITPGTRRLKRRTTWPGSRRRSSRPTSGCRPLRCVPSRPPSSYNGARWQLQQARRDARVADRHAAIAASDAKQQRHSYAATVVASYEAGPSLSPISAVTGSNGLPAVVSKMATLQNAQDAMDHTYDAFRASSTLAGVASTQAETARARAEALATQAREARDRAAAAAAAANSQTQALASEKTQLIRRLAQLQHVSVALAEQRQAGIEQAAREAAQKAAEQAAREAAQKAARQAAAGRPARRSAGRSPGRSAGCPAGTGERPAFRRSRLRPDRLTLPDQPPDAGADAADHPPGSPGRSCSAGSGVGRWCRDRLRSPADRRPLCVGSGRAQRLGLLGADDGRLARRRDLAAALLGRAVLPVDPDLPELAPARRPRLLGLHELAVVDLPRRALRRATG